jgi:hypothetical protein
MVSNLDYFSLKNKVIAKNDHPFETLVLIILFMALLIIKAKSLLFPLGLVYITSGPIATLIRSRPGRGASPAAEPPESSGEEPAPDGGGPQPNAEGRE